MQQLHNESNERRADQEGHIRRPATSKSARYTGGTVTSPYSACASRMASARYTTECIECTSQRCALYTR
eukprot:5564820-Pyramimonas_sp.AAC.1